jgi:acyl-CoA synthetase (AMP-forming)/AMP-acid ligase II
MSFADHEVLRSAHPARVALIDGATGRTLTAGQLADGARRVAGGLAARGIGRGDVVTLVAGNTPEFAVATYGVLAAGAAVASANPMLTSGELARLFAGFRTRLVLTDVPLPDPGVPVVHSVAELLGPPAGPVAGRTPQDPAFLFCSSGTSGLPKPALHTHAGTCAFLRAFAALPATHLEPADVVAPTAPFTHLYGGAVVMHALRSGARAVTMPLAMPVEERLRVLADHAVTVLHTSPPLLQALARHPLVDRLDLSALRCVISSAAPLEPALKQAVETRLGCAVVDCLGLTEAWGFTADGRFAPGVEAQIVEPASGRPLGAGKPGELWIRGPQIMAGYLDGTGVGPGGWLHTGDLCALDARGRLTVLDRLKDMIKVGGHSVSPAEVERELAAHPDVIDVAVAGRADAECGEVPVAFAVLRDGADPDAVRGWLHGRLAPWKQVREVVPVDAVPRSPAGKLLRRELLSQPVA